MPTEAIFNPLRPASSASLLRNSITCCAAHVDRIANLRAQLDHRLVHLRFDLLLKHDLAALENLLDVRTQFARNRIDNREFLLDPESVGVRFCAHGRGASVPQKRDGVTDEMTSAG